MTGEPFESNLAKLLTRAPPDDGPSEAFRQRVTQAVLARVAQPTVSVSATEPPRRLQAPRPMRRRLWLPLAAIAAAAASWIGVPLLRTGLRGPSNPPSPVARSGGPDEALPEQGRREAPDQRPADGRAGSGPTDGATRVAEAPQEAPSDDSLATPEPRAEAHVHIVVLGPEGEPVRRFRAATQRDVEVPEVAAPEYIVVDAEDGRAALPTRPDGTLTLVIEVEGAAPWRSTGLTPNPPATPLIVQLERGAPVFGAVSDVETGSPLPGALVYVESALPHDVVDLFGEDLDPRPLHAVFTDGAGVFRIPCAPNGSQVLRASARGYAPSWVAVTVPASIADGATTPVEAPSFRLGRGGTVSGWVEQVSPAGSRGAPSVGSEIVISTLAMGGRRASGAGSPRAPFEVMTYGTAVTDGEGRFAVDCLPAGEFIALCFDDPALGARMPRMQMTTVQNGVNSVIDFLAPGDEGHASAGTDAPRWTLAGVVRSADGEAQAEVDLALYEIDLGTWRATRTDAHGRFSYGGLTAGRWAVCRARAGYTEQQVLDFIDLRAGVITRPVGRYELEITLPRGSLAVEALDVAGVHVGLGQVVLEREVEVGELAFHAVQRLDDSGVTVVDSLPTGLYFATVIPADGRSGHSRVGPLQVYDGSPATTVVSLPLGGTLQVQVVEPAPDAPAGSAVDSPARATLVLRDASGRKLQLDLDPRTDASGARSLNGLAPGLYSVEARTLDGRRATAQAQVRAGAVERVLVRL